MKKWVEIALGIMLGLLLLFRGAELWVGSKMKKVATSELYKASDGVYKLDIGRVSVGLFDRSVKIKNVTIETDSMRLDQITLETDILPEAERRYKPGLKLSIAELFVKGISFKRHDSSVPADTAANEPIAENSLHQSLSNIFDKLTVSRIRMRGVDGEYSVRKGTDTVHHSIRRTTIEADDYDLNSDPLQYPLHFHDIRLTVRRFEHTCQFGSMTMRADTLKASTARGSISVNSLNIEPNYEKEEFARMNPKHIDWTFYRLSKIAASGIDVASLVYRKHIAADSITISRLDAGSYKDRNVERVEWVKYMFYESLHKLPLTIDVKSLVIADGSAFYEELPKDGHESATIRFSDLNARMSDLSNMPDPPAKNITIDATCKVMEKGELKVKFLAPASPSDSRFEITGSLGPVDMAPFNAVTVPLANIRIDSGRIDGIDFHVTGGASRSQVEMTMLYSDLYAMIIKEDPDGDTHDRKLLSTLANSMLFNESNPDRHGKLHKGSGATQRDIYRSQYNYMWKSLLPGIVESVGIPESLDRQQYRRHGPESRRNLQSDLKNHTQGNHPRTF